MSQPLEGIETVMISGSRNFTNLELVREFIESLDEDKHMVVVGDARGVDAIAARACLDFNIACNVYLADWSLYGRSAGILRNLDMLKRAKSVVAFWDEKSKGTKHAIDHCIKHDIPCTIIRSDGSVYDAREIIKPGTKRRKKS